MQDIVISVIANLISAINEIVHPISASCSAALPLFHVFPFATAAAMPLGLFVSAFLSTSGRAAISAPVPLFCISVARFRNSFQALRLTYATTSTTPTPPTPWVYRSVSVLNASMTMMRRRRMIITFLGATT